MSEPSWRISMSRPPQDFGVFARKNSRIGRSVAEKHHSEPVRRKAADDFFRGKVLRVRVRFIRERWSEYRNHEKFLGLYPGFQCLKLVANRWPLVESSICYGDLLKRGRSCFGGRRCLAL